LNFATPHPIVFRFSAVILLTASQIKHPKNWHFPGTSHIPRYQEIWTPVVSECGNCFLISRDSEA
jgi:hypothetical protein